MTLALVVALVALPLVAGAAFLAARHDPAVPLREDYRTYDLRRLEAWGYNGAWADDRHTAVQITGPTPREGDVVIGHADDVHVITAVTTTMRAGMPTDRSTATVRPWRRRRNLSWRLPERTQPTGDDLL